MNMDHSVVGATSSPETKLLNAALCKAHAAMKTIKLDGVNPHFKSKFSTFAEACETIRGPLTDAGLTLPVFQHAFFGSSWVLVATLRHVSGEWISGMAPLLLAKSDMQALGAATTYAKRTLLLALTGAFSGEDDDDGESNRVDAARVASARVVAACTPSETNGRKVDHRLATRVSDAEDRAMTSMNQATTKVEADRVLAKAKLWHSEKSIGTDGLLRVQQAFDARWKKQEATV